MTKKSHPYAALTPETMLDAVDACGYRCDGRMIALSSYENRVYQFWLEDGSQIVAKFYRPERWTDEAIEEEQRFAAELAVREIPVVAPLNIRGRTLMRHGGFRYALYPKAPGRPPEFDDDETLTWLGRFVARIHAVGALEPFHHRPRLDVATYGRGAVDFILKGGFVPADIAEAYRSVAEDVLDRIGERIDMVGPARRIRLHGDCHAGNILWTDAGPHFVDLDDACTGPAVQDIWMWLSGDRAAMEAQLGAIVEGYRQFHAFDVTELGLVEVLRTLRLMNYAAWLARRWSDPAFPANFPFFNTQRYWQDHILALREQAAALEEPPLTVDC